MDDRDATLIRALQDDGRTSVSRLAALIGESRAAASARLRRLLGDGTVRVVGAVDPAVLGQHVFAHVSLVVRGPAREVADALRAEPASVLVSATGGSHDLVTELRVGSMSELHDLLGVIRRMAGVDSIETLVYTHVVKGFMISSSHEEVSIDVIDARLIAQLQVDGRTSYRQLGELVRLSPSAVTARVRRLVDDGVLLISAVESRGLAHQQLSMGVGLNLADESERVLEQLHASRDVDFAACTIGRFDAVATLVAPTAGGLFDAVERIRSMPGVHGVEAWLHMAVLKEDYARTLRPARVSRRPGA